MTASFAHSGPMTDQGELDLASVRRDAVARTIVHEWRSLTGGARTLLACSGGADSVALTLAIAAAVRDMAVVAHVVHDMRCQAESFADRDGAGALAQRLGLDFVERHVHLPSGNAEAGARRARLDALEAMAIGSGCAFVATGHHADDQLESILLALGRGAGIRGLRGAAASRSLGHSGVQLVRPMLRVSHEDSMRLCRVAGVAWREDQTNDDESRRRAALRSRVLPELRQLFPEISGKSSEAASMIADAFVVVQDRVNQVFGEGYSWPREVIRNEPRLVIGEGLRAAFGRLSGGAGLDRIPKREIDRVIDAIRDESAHERRFNWPVGVGVFVSAGLVTMKMGSEGALK